MTPLGLADLLKAGTIAGAGLDVFEFEPTINPKLLGLPNEIGTIAVGKSADLIALEGNPLDDILRMAGKAMR